MPSQDYINFEYIIIDGGSTDDTSDIIRKYDDSGHLISEKDKGQYHAIRKGFLERQVISFVGSILMIYFCFRL